jgi:hypothetical protein
MYYTGWKYHIDNEDHFKTLQRYWIDKHYTWVTGIKNVLDFDYIYNEC